MICTRKLSHTIEVQIFTYTSQDVYHTMKFILIFVFVSSLNLLTLLAEEIPQENNSEAPASNDDPSANHRVALNSLKRGVGKRSSGRWHKVNYSPICFGTRGDQFGRFYVPSSGKLAAIKLVHLYGYVSCAAILGTSAYSYWCCGLLKGRHAWVNDLVAVVITTSANHILFPSRQFIVSSHKWSKIPGYTSLSPELVLSVFSRPHWVTSGQELRLWFGDDLVNRSEGDNGGKACCDVYALFV